jgi:hypothetical protein
VLHVSPAPLLPCMASAPPFTFKNELKAMYAAHLARASSSPAKAGESQKQSGTISSSLPRWKATAANGRFEMNFSNLR